MTLFTYRPIKMEKKKIRVLVSNTHNPWFNLATENYIFKDMAPDTAVLFLWRNSETVVIGRYQNPWIECNTEKMEQAKVKLARRQSGGGAVYHDLGNTNFTFLNGKKDFSKERNNQIICGALKKFGIESYASGRNDLVVDTEGSSRKISGSAYRENSDRSFHHGTMLIDVDMSKLANYLSPSKKKLESKGVSSVRSRVLNISELNSTVDHKGFSEAIIQSFFDAYENEVEVEVLDEATLEKIPELKTYYNQLSSWDWCFGKAPKFDHSICERLSFGTVELMFTTEKGRVIKVDVNSDCLAPQLIEAWVSALCSVQYSPEGIEAASKVVMKSLSGFKEESLEVKEWILSEIV
ncbi:MAG: lipoate--protein ligase [Bacteriovoracaceae bacterium]|nr:lipoate--protein ligase [Bacteriovoracaceae bacterium]